MWFHDFWWTLRLFHGFWGLLYLSYVLQGIQLISIVFLLINSANCYQSSMFGVDSLNMANLTMYIIILIRTTHTICTDNIDCKYDKQPDNVYCLFNLVTRRWRETVAYQLISVGFGNNFTPIRRQSVTKSNSSEYITDAPLYHYSKIMLIP